jgi:hypothetical protein
MAIAEAATTQPPMIVTLAKAGAHRANFETIEAWVPAFAGMVAR